MSTGEVDATVSKRTCLLTGAGGLLGSAFCERYAATYEILAVCGRRAPAVPSQHEWYVDPLAPYDDVPENASAVHVVHADLTDPADVERVVELSLVRLGGVDLLVNNAARLGVHHASLIEGDAAVLDLERQLVTNVVAPFRLTSRLAREFWRDRAADNQARSRNVVNVSSLAAMSTFPLLGPGYGASKAALNAVGGHLAHELGTFGVRVNTIVPDSFPARVATEAVVDAIVELDRGRTTGSVTLLEGD